MKETYAKYWQKRNLWMQGIQECLCQVLNHSFCCFAPQLLCVSTCVWLMPTQAGPNFKSKLCFSNTLMNDKLNDFKLTKQRNRATSKDTNCQQVRLSFPYYQLLVSTWFIHSCKSDCIHFKTRNEQQMLELPDLFAKTIGDLSQLQILLQPWTSFVSVLQPLFRCNLSVS